MLFKLPMAGSAFKKNILRSAYRTSQYPSFVPAEDLVVAYGASNLRTAPAVYTRYEEDTRRSTQATGKTDSIVISSYLQLLEMLLTLKRKYNELEGSEPTFSDDPTAYYTRNARRFGLT